MDQDQCGLKTINNFSKSNEFTYDSLPLHDETVNGLDNSG